MARVTCRCGEAIEAPGGGVEKIVCPRCQTRIRIRRSSERPPDDGYIRFSCPCGRRLKVRAASGLEAGKCPDCGRVVPIPDQTSAGSLRTGPDDPDARTDEFDKDDVARLARWAARHGVSADSAARPPAPSRPQRPAPPASNFPAHHLPETPAQTPPPSPPPTFRRESGLRVCPRCRNPLHMNATVCRSCGESTPKG